MPKLIRLYISQCAIGFGIAALFTAMLLYLDVARLWYLVTHSDVGWLAVLMIWVHFGVLFAGVQFAIAIMRMGSEDQDNAGSGGGGGRRRLRPGLAEPIRAVVPGSTRIPRAGRKSLFSITG
ncbi:hypothetical protein [Cognatishimia sp. F0-27]|uniref:hypothetical protein n=1 Tax=Cognatishimia sp. F0-27 TaxID=2816855 RepID=UPI001D0BF710|nr:hypothetical protein [Cognatishimia sp. F0-27]MCC1493662.1 hypothetical protein [Cognatishimia sp. F0-27]